MEESKKPKKIRHDLGTFQLNKDLVENAVNNHEDRLIELETRIFKTERKSLITRAQQMLLLKHSGVLEFLKQYKLSNKKLAKFLSDLLNASEANIEDDLSNIYKEDSYLKSSYNYKAITKTFKNAGLKQLFEETDQMLDKIIKEENKK